MWSDGRPVPWMTYPAICYLEQIDFSDKRIFEYGAGSSTEYWSARSLSVTSVEHDESWFTKVSALRLPNVALTCATHSEYVSSVSLNPPHDVIVIDGRWRFDCSRAVLPNLADDGMIIVDNAERYPMINSHFREHGLIQIDMIGYGPINSYIWCTSFFLTRKFSFKPLARIQPRRSPGLIDGIEDQPKWHSENKPGAFG